MADRLARIVIVSSNRCKPKKCSQQCNKSCPVVTTVDVGRWEKEAASRSRVDDLKGMPSAKHIINPATRSSFFLPASYIYYPNMCEFVSNPTLRVYKLLVVEDFHNIRAKLFSIGIDSTWRNLDGAIPIANQPWVRKPLVNGAIHWIFFDDTVSGVAAFDIDDERFQTVGLPEGLLFDVNLDFLTNFQGSLSVSRSQKGGNHGVGKPYGDISLYIESLVHVNATELENNPPVEMLSGMLLLQGITHAFMQPADIYLIDEPSAYLESEQGIVASEHLDVTFRRDPTNYRPHINKLDSTKDREQKAAGSYYYLDD
ncbi:ABC transporter E family member 2 [Nymphaea thermarum]|nr:ABC transporter E family member 2 [Nymphaea thermarum]